MDRATAREDQIEFARCFVEIVAANPLPKEVSLAILNGDQVSVPVEYEWVPHRCSHCIYFGHVNAQCLAIRVWREKQTPGVVEMETERVEVTSRSAENNMEVEEPQVPQSKQTPPDNIDIPLSNTTKSLAELHYERNGVPSDYIVDSEDLSEEMEDSEKEENASMDEEQNPPNPITVENPEWQPVVENAMKAGAAKSMKQQKEKPKKNLLKLKKTTEKPARPKVTKERVNHTHS